MLKAVGFVFAPIPSSPGAAFFRGALGGPAETIHKPMVYHQYVAARTIKMILYNFINDSAAAGGFRQNRIPTRMNAARAM